MRRSRRWILAPALGLALAVGASTESAADGKALFEKNCMRCHGADGGADTAAGKKMKVPAWEGNLVADEVVKHVREHPKHRTVSKKVTDAELQEIAAYAATLGGP